MAKGVVAMEAFEAGGCCLPARGAGRLLFSRSESRKQRKLAGGCSAGIEASVVGCGKSDPREATLGKSALQEVGVRQLWKYGLVVRQA